MAVKDSAIDITQPGVFRDAPGVSEEIVLHPKSGQPVRINRGDGGKFVKQKKTMPPSADITRLMRNLLLQAEAGPDGKMSRGDKTRIRRMFDNVLDIATTSPNQPVLDKLGNPLLDSEGQVITVKDAKMAMASVKAFEALMLRAYGAPSKSEEEIDALKTQGVKMVIVMPPEMMNKEVREEKPREKLAPSFISAEVVENGK